MRASAQPTATRTESIAPAGVIDGGTDPIFQLLFERSADPIWLFDPRPGVFIDCNEAAIALMRAASKSDLLGLRPSDLAPEYQPNGQPSAAMAQDISERVEKSGAVRFEWLARRRDGTLVPLEVTGTRIEVAGRVLQVVISRDITERKQAEAEIQRLAETLERRIAERTAELQESEARLRTLVEHAPEAIVVLDGTTGRFLLCNENAEHLYGLSRDELLNLHPADVSPLVQPDGRASVEAATGYIQQALRGEAPIFDWTHKHSSGRLLPCEVRLVRLPAEGRSLVRGSILDNTERRRRERIQHATYAISAAAQEAQDLTTLFRDIHSAIASLMPARNFYISLVDEKAAQIEFPYYVGEWSAVPPGPLPLGTGLTSFVVRTGEPLLMDAALNARKRTVGNQVTFDGMEGLSYIEAGRPAAIWLGVPLLVQGKTIGVMAVQDYHDDRAYGEEEKQILTFVARQTALAIDRKRAEQALRESEQKYRVLFEASSQGVIIHDANQYLEVNPAALRIFGLNHPEELTGRHPRDTSPPVQPGGEPSEALAQAHIQTCLQKGTDRFEWVCRTAQGEHVPLEVILTRVEMGGRHLIQAVLNDISERKRGEAALREREARLRESEARFSAAFHGSPILIALSRMNDGGFVEVNDAFARWCGLPRQEILGRTSMDLQLWVEADERDRFLRELMEKQSLRHRECALRSPRGSLHTILLSGEIVGVQGQPHYLVVGLDITERKMAEAELQRALSHEMELSRLKSNFVSMVSHEFRTPLGIISSSAEILRDYLDTLPPQDRREHLESITTNVRRMAGLMEEVLVLGRLDSGRLEFEPRPTDLPMFCRRLIDEVLAATDRRCPVVLNLGEFDTPAQADERLLRHILINTLSNAVKYSDPGQEVCLKVFRRETSAVFIVQDQGIGIPEEDRAWLFTAFYRGHNVGQRPGSGLGLVIVKRCVDLHAGRLDLQSRPGKGTEVRIELPVFPP